jgi:hypothetical protein
MPSACFSVPIDLLAPASGTLFGLRKAKAIAAVPTARYFRSQPEHSETNVGKIIFGSLYGLVSRSHHDETIVGRIRSRLTNKRANSNAVASEETQTLLNQEFFLIFRYRPVPTEHSLHCPK